MGEQVKYNAKGEAILVKGDLQGDAQANADRGAFVAGLRQLADLLEACPSCPLPEYYGGFKLVGEVANLQELRAAFHLSGPWEKEYHGDLADYHKPLAIKETDDTWGKSPFPLQYTVRIKREEVCKKIKTGSHYVPPSGGYYVPSTTGHTVDDYSWECI